MTHRGDSEVPTTDAVEDRRPRQAAPGFGSRRAPGRWFAAIGWSAGVLGALTLLVGAVPATQRWAPAAVAAAFVPYGVVAWAVAVPALLLAGGRRRTRAAVLAAAVLVVQLVWTRPYWPHAPAVGPDGAPRISILTVNLRCDTVDTTDLAADINRIRPDVVVLVDVVPGVWRELRPTVLADFGAFHQSTRRSSQPEVFEKEGEPCFTGIAARGSIVLWATTATDNPQHIVRIRLHEASLTLIAVDVENLQAPSAWVSDLSAVREAVRAVDPDEPLVVLGDFNAVREHAPMAALRAEGLVDAAEQAGAGWVRTFPSGGLLPPLVAIDHVMVRGGLVVEALETFRVAGTDHLGLDARISVAVPVAPG